MLLYKQQLLKSNKIQVAKFRLCSTSAYSVYHKLQITLDFNLRQNLKFLFKKTMLAKPIKSNHFL
jgi:hypothetical protein